MMDAVFFNGFNSKDSDSERVSVQLIDLLQNNEFKVDLIILRDTRIAHCQGCFDCWLKTPGKCRIRDFGQETAQKMVDTNLIIHFTPITFGGYSYELKQVIDRFLPTITPFMTKRQNELHHVYRYKQRASIIAIGILDNHDEEQEAIFKQLAYRNSLNMGGPIHETLIYIKQWDSKKESEFWEDFQRILAKLGGKI